MPIKNMDFIYFRNMQNILKYEQIWSEFDLKISYIPFTLRSYACVKV